MSSFKAPGLKQKEKILVEKTVYFLGRFLSRETSGSTMSKLHALIRHDCGRKTKARFTMDGFSSGNKAAKSAEVASKHAYEYIPLASILRFSRDSPKVLILAVNLGLNQCDILVYRAKTELDAKSLENTYKYLVSIYDVASIEATRNIMHFQSNVDLNNGVQNTDKLPSGCGNLTPSSSSKSLSNQDHQVYDVIQNSTPASAFSNNVNQQDTQEHEIISDSFDFLRFEIDERSKDDSFVQYNGTGYLKNGSRPLNSHAYSSHNRRMFSSQDLRPSLAFRTWDMHERGVQTDFNTNLLTNITNSNSSTDTPILTFKQGKLYVVNGVPVNDVSCYVVSEISTPNLPRVAYVMKPLIDSDKGNLRNHRVTFCDNKETTTTVTQSSQDVWSNNCISMATQTSFVEDNAQTVTEAHSSNSSDIEKQVHELKEEVMHLRSLIEIPQVNEHLRNTSNDAPIGAHVIKTTHIQRTDSDIKGHVLNAGQKSSDGGAIGARVLTHRPASTASVDSAYGESEPHTLERIPKPLYSSTPRDLKALAKRDSFRLKISSAIPKPNSSKVEPPKKPKRQSLQRLSSSQVDLSRSPSAKPPSNSSKSKVPKPKEKSMRMTEPSRMVFSARAQSTDRLHTAHLYGGNQPSDYTHAKHITRIPVTNAQISARTPRSSGKSRDPEPNIVTSARDLRHRSNSPHARKLMYDLHSGNHQASRSKIPVVGPTRYRSSMYLPTGQQQTEVLY